MKRLMREVLVAVIALAVVGTLAAYGVRGWKLLVLCALLLVVYFRPRGDAAARRERRIERRSDALAREIEDWRDILRRTVAKVPPDKEPPPLALRTQIGKDDAGR